MQVMKTHPKALRINFFINGNEQAHVLYFENNEKLERWNHILNQIVQDPNLKMSRSLSRRSANHSHQVSLAN